jgi:hypothetical protein
MSIHPDIARAVQHEHQRDLYLATARRRRRMRETALVFPDRKEKSWQTIRTS